jgi:site-specific recombinase XerD
MPAAVDTVFEQNENELNGGFAFPHKEGGQQKAKFSGKQIRIGKEAGIENFTTLHARRHTFASQLVMKGVDLPTVQRLLGYSDIQTTMIFAHLAHDHLDEAVNKLSLT